MTAALNDRAARRRTIAFFVLLVTSVVLMAVSSNPLVRDLQSGVGFAFRPIQAALDSVGVGGRFDRLCRLRDRSAARR